MLLLFWLLWGIIIQPCQVPLVLKIRIDTTVKQRIDIHSYMYMIVYKSCPVTI